MTLREQAINKIDICFKKYVRELSISDNMYRLVDYYDGKLMGLLYAYRSVGIISQEEYNCVYSARLACIEFNRKVETK